MRHLLLMLALLVAGPVLANAPEAAGLDELRRAAEAGQVDAQYELGVLYEFGYRFPDHKVTAYAWYSRAAEQGNAAAAQRRDAMKGQMSQAELDRAAALIASMPAAAAQAAPPVSVTTPPVTSDPTPTQTAATPSAAPAPDAVAPAAPVEPVPTKN